MLTLDSNIDDSRQTSTNTIVSFTQVVPLMRFLNVANLQCTIISHLHIRVVKFKVLVVTRGMSCRNSE